MNLTISGHHLEVTPALREYMESKLQRLQRHFDQHCEIRTQMALNKPDHHVEATVNLPGKTLHADASAPTMYAAIDLLADKLDRLVIKHKEKSQDHRAREVRDNQV